MAIALAPVAVPAAEAAGGLVLLGIAFYSAKSDAEKAKITAEMSAQSKRLGKQFIDYGIKLSVPAVLMAAKVLHLTGVAPTNSPAPNPSKEDIEKVLNKIKQDSNGGPGNNLDPFMKAVTDLAMIGLVAYLKKQGQNNGSHDLKKGIIILENDSDFFTKIRDYLGQFDISSRSLSPSHRAISATTSGGQQNNQSLGSSNQLYDEMDDLLRRCYQGSPQEKSCADILITRGSNHTSDEALDAFFQLQQLGANQSGHVNSYGFRQRVQALYEEINTVRLDLGDTAHRSNAILKAFDLLTSNPNDLAVKVTFFMALFGNLYGVATPNKEYLDQIKNFVGNKPVVELGAGNGYYALRLQQLGIKVRAIDPGLGEYRDTWMKKWVNIEGGGPSSLTKSEFKDHVLMIAAPGPGKLWVEEAFKKFKGDKIIFIPYDFGRNRSAEEQRVSVRVANYLQRNFDLQNFNFESPADPGGMKAPCLYVRKPASAR